MLSKENPGAIMAYRNYYKALNIFNDSELPVSSSCTFMMRDVVRADARDTLYLSPFDPRCFSIETSLVRSSVFNDSRIICDLLGISDKTFYSIYS